MSKPECLSEVGSGPWAADPRCRSRREVPGGAASAGLVSQTLDNSRHPNDGQCISPNRGTCTHRGSRAHGLWSRCSMTEIAAGGVCPVGSAVAEGVSPSGSRAGVVARLPRRSMCEHLACGRRRRCPPPHVGPRTGRRGLVCALKGASTELLLWHRWCWWSCPWR